MGNAHELIALANLGICLVAVFMCLCRLNLMTPDVLFRVRAQYAGKMAAAFASALAPMWGEWPMWGALAMSAALVAALASSASEWHDGPPDRVRDRRKELRRGERRRNQDRRKATPEARG